MSRTDWNGTPSDEDLVAFVLDPSSVAPALRARLDGDASGDPELAGRVKDTRAFLATCRAALAPGAGRVEQGEAGALLERVLARTTREDLSWRGDLRLVRGFVGRALHDSRSLRVAALVLGMHFLGLSVLAYQVLRRPPQPQLHIDFETPALPPFVEPEAEPSPELTVPTTSEEPEVRAVPPADAR